MHVATALCDVWKGRSVMVRMKAGGVLCWPGWEDEGSVGVGDGGRR